MAIKKTKLYSSLWASANELRGTKEAFENTDRCITIPVSGYEEHVSAWCSYGIGKDDWELVAKGELPDGYN